VKVVKKFVSPIPSKQSKCLRTSELEDDAADAGESALTESPPMAKLVSENTLREPWIFIQGADPTKDYYRLLTDKD